MAGEARELAAERPGQRLGVSILGVTPELATLAWPEGTEITAFDRSRQMIEHVWPRAAVLEGARAVAAEWTRLPISSGALDLVCGDGCHCLLSLPGEHRRLHAEVRRVLRPGGRFVIRAFVRPEEREGVEAIVADLRAGKIGNFHVLKWRLTMALQRSTAEGVRVADVWEAHRALAAEPAMRRFPEEVVSTIDAYRDAPARYTFPTLAELGAGLAEHFTLVACHTPGYELGERCPTLVLRAAGCP